MPLIGPSIKSRFKTTIYNGLKKNFSAAASKGTGFPAVADEFWMKLADAISDIAADLVDEMHNNAQVVPGQSVTVNVVTVGSPSTQSGPGSGVTVSPGKIL